MPKGNKLADRLMARTADLAKKVEEGAAARPANTGVRSAATMPAQLGAFRLEAREYQKRIQELTDQLAEARKSGGILHVPLSDLHEVPGRRRHKSPEEYAELRENLRHNKLIHPVAIRPRLEGGFEIVSGHWRTDAYRELERPDIECVLSEGTEDEATVGAFYANLLQSDLTDFEKYLGFKDIQQRFPGITQVKMAELSGINPSVVSELMSFEQLPQVVLDVLEKRPGLIGANYGSDFARLVREGKSDRVVEAVMQLVAGKIDQTQAVRLAAADPSKPRQATSSETVKIKSGRVVYCSVRVTSRILRLEFQSEDEARAAQEELRKLLEQRAERAKSERNADSEK
ncbi:ParB/RepB/Spo0J family partition protein [Burkholderia cenocepacia]|uniref:ParB/RepB/Spo0J family partition protein n=1 Tax=Burkholderia cenocepacia TaxID=95486 RepID=UPI001BA1ED3B|nr:ParB N-terminal domain-containing protein [Burkholderia cenocepacia]MBR8427256.1 ParB N-terminal domain-containing protein [Burkholderia cenocepacia]